MRACVPACVPASLRACVRAWWEAGCLSYPEEETIPAWNHVGKLLLSHPKPRMPRNLRQERRAYKHYALPYLTFGWQVNPPALRSHSTLQHKGALVPECHDVAGTGLALLHGRLAASPYKAVWLTAALGLQEPLKG